MQLNNAQNDDSKAEWNLRLGFLSHKYYHLRYRLFEKKTTRINRVVENARTVEFKLQSKQLLEAISNTKRGSFETA